MPNQPNRAALHAKSENGIHSRSHWSKSALVLGLLGCCVPVLGGGQNSINAPPHPNTILLPAANNLPDANGIMLMNQNQINRKSFDAANALRQKQIDEDTAKLLILAKDFNEQVDKLGNRPLTARLAREAEVIELLAHDVHLKMTLTVGGG
jgi:hypothetical protein